MQWFAALQNDTLHLGSSACSCRCRPRKQQRGGPGKRCTSGLPARLRGAFTLIEAMVAIALAAIAGAALLLGVTSSLQTTDDNLRRTIAMGIAEQLMDEVLGNPYKDKNVGPYQTNVGPNSWEASTGTRERFDDLDDYNRVRSRPPVDTWGIPLGQEDGAGGLRHPNFRLPDNFLQQWREEIEVYYVDPNDFTRRLPYGSVSDYRAVEVRVLYETPEGGRRELARLRRIVAYVPPM